MSDMVAAGDVAIPTANESLSAKRVLTMTFEEGLSLGDVHMALQKHHNSGSVVGTRPGGNNSVAEISKSDLMNGEVSPHPLPYKASDVAYLVSKAFCEQM